MHMWITPEDYVCGDLFFCSHFPQHVGPILLILLLIIRVQRDYFLLAITHWWKGGDGVCSVGDICPGVISWETAFLIFMFCDLLISVIYPLTLPVFWSLCNLFSHLEMDCSMSVKLIIFKKTSSLKVVLLGEPFKWFQVLYLWEFICESTLFLCNSGLAEKETQGKKETYFRNI